MSCPSFTRNKILQQKLSHQNTTLIRFDIILWTWEILIFDANKWLTSNNAAWNGIDNYSIWWRPNVEVIAGQVHLHRALTRFENVNTRNDGDAFGWLEFQGLVSINVEYVKRIYNWLYTFFVMLPINLSKLTDSPWHITATSMHCPLLPFCRMVNPFSKPFTSLDITGRREQELQATKSSVFTSRIYTHLPIAGFGVVWPGARVMVVVVGMVAGAAVGGKVDMLFGIGWVEESSIFLLLFRKIN